QIVGQAGDEPVEELFHRRRRERLQGEGRRVASRGAEAETPLDQLGPRKREHEYGMGSRPLEQVLDEIEERRVDPLQVLEDEDDGAPLGEAFEEEAPSGEEILPVATGVLGQAEQVRETRLEPGLLVGIRD